jgi:hypothetical protein
MNKDVVADALADLLLRLDGGCGNLGCVIEPPRVGTNDICRCRPKQIAKELHRLARELDDKSEWEG